MADQLVLLDPRTGEDDFRLDSHTRELGRRGVAQARRALADVVRAAAERDALRRRDAAA